MSKEAIAYHLKWIDDEKDLRDRYEVMQDYAEKYHKEQLLLHNVSQQRKLLIKAFDLINIHDGDKEKIAKLVDITLKSINCG